MIAKPSNQTIKILLASAFFLFYSLVIYGQSGFYPNNKASSAFEVSGLSGKRSDYYRNLMIQDIALPQQMAVENIRLSMRYHISYSLDRTSAETWELRIRPDSIGCSPVPYFGFDVAEFMTPVQTTLTFLVANQYGLVEDSLIFTGVRINGDGDLYYSRSFTSGSSAPALVFSSVRPVYDEAGYGCFRDGISLVDNYYAASALLDSTLHWTSGNFPAGRECFWNYYLQYTEVSRILQYTGRTAFPAGLSEQSDPAGYYELVSQVSRRKVRALTILLRMASERQGNLPAQHIPAMARAYSGWVIMYSDLARSSGHRFSAYFSGLSALDLYAGWTNRHWKLLRGLILPSGNERNLYNGLRIAAAAAAGNFKIAAESKKSQGDDVLALTWYQDALDLLHAVPGTTTDTSLVRTVASLKMEMAESYLSLARMAALRSTIAVTEGYLEKAREIYGELLPVSSPAAAPLLEVEKEVYTTYCNRAGELIQGNQYYLALDYLSFLLDKCSECRYDCTGDVNRMLLQAKTGWYLQLMDRAERSYFAGDYTGATEALRKAIEVRTGIGSRIARDSREIALSSLMEQDAYRIYVSEGSRYLHYQQYEIALFYLNKARALEIAGVPAPDPDLPALLAAAARPVIENTIETGRARAMGYFFDEGWQALLTARNSMKEYGLKEDEELNRQTDDLEEQLRTYRCEKLRKDYTEMLLDARFKKENGDYITAMDRVTQSITLLMDDTLCTINDQEAWYLRAQLEYPAEFMKRLNLALSLIPGDPEGFVASYDNLYRYYQSMKLTEYGVTFVPLHQRIMQQTNAAFLDGILGYYIRSGQKNNALDVLHHLWNTGHRTPGAGRQRELASWLALQDMADEVSDPVAQLNSYVPDTGAYRSFRHKYKYTWLKSSGWKVQYFSLFLKNKSVED